MYQITKWFLIIETNKQQEFFQIYDKAIENIPDGAFNKKWYRSTKRTFAGQSYGKLRFLIPLNNPTIKKIVNSA